MPLLGNVFGPSALGAQSTSIHDPGRIMSQTITADKIRSNMEHTEKSLMDIRIEAIENGYIVLVRPGPLKDVKRVYIASIDELAGVVSAQIAAERILGDRK